jgi:hypothetical protein
MTFRTWLSESTTRSATRPARPLGVPLLLGVLLLGLAMVDGTVPAAHAQKGGGGGTGPVLPTVRYRLQWIDGGPGWDATSPRDINKAGDLVGYAYVPNVTNGVASAFARPNGGTPFNLNDLDADWWDLDEPVPTLAGGWWARFALGINDSGVIVGDATNADPNLPRRAFVLVNAFSPPTGPAPYFLLLPTVGAGHQLATKINNFNQAVGVAGAGAIRYLPVANWPYYQAVLAISDTGIISGNLGIDINDAGDIIAESNFSGSWRQRGDTGEKAYYADHNFARINNARMICGSRGSNKRSVLAGGAFRLPATALTGSAAQIIYPGYDNNYARAMNDSGDTVVHVSGGRGILYTDAINPRTNARYGTNGDGIMPLDSLVSNPDAGWLHAAYLRFDGSNNRVDPDHPDSTGFGQICGRAQGNGYDRGFLLTPLLP